MSCFLRLRYLAFFTGSVRCHRKNYNLIALERCRNLQKKKKCGDCQFYDFVFYWRRPDWEPFIDFSGSGFWSKFQAEEPRYQKCIFSESNKGPQKRSFCPLEDKFYFEERKVELKQRCPLRTKVSFGPGLPVALCLSRE